MSTVDVEDYMDAKQAAVLVGRHHRCARVQLRQQRALERRKHVRRQVIPRHCHKLLDTARTCCQRAHQAAMADRPLICQGTETGGCRVDEGRAWLWRQVLLKYVEVCPSYSIGPAA